MTKKDDEDFENSSKSWICDNFYVKGDVKRSLLYHWKIQKFSRQTL